MPLNIRRALALALLALVVSLLSFSARAELQLTDADAAAIKSVITEQIEAFRRDDGAAAFSLAAPGIRAKFGSPEVFLQMVREAYPAVYRPDWIYFEQPEVIDDAVLQPVRLTDADGRAWIALYPMERQPDGVWRINGCQLARLQGRET